MECEYEGEGILSSGVCRGWEMAYRGGGQLDFYPPQDFKIRYDVIIIIM